MDTRKTVSLYEAKTHLSALVDEAAAGVEITITKHGKALAKISSVAPVRSDGGVRRLGAFSDPKAKIDWDAWWTSWKRMDLEQQRAFEKSLNDPWDFLSSKEPKTSKRRAKRS